MGGGFGSKLEPGKYTLAAALLSRQTGRPVKLLPLARGELPLRRQPPAQPAEDEGRGEEGRHADRAAARSGIGTGGAYPEGSDAGYLTSDLYLCPNVRIEETNVYINAGKARAFRAPGFPQGAWALEQAMDALAQKLGMDPLALRLKNVPKVSQRRGGIPYFSTGLAQCLQDGAKAFGWDGGAQAAARQRTRRARRRRRRRHVGLGRRPAGDGDPALRRRRQREPDHRRLRHRHRHQDVDGDDRRGGARRPRREHPRRPRRHRHDAVRRSLRRQPDGARQLARGARGGARREAAAARDGGRAAEGGRRVARAEGRGDRRPRARPRRRSRSRT